MLLKDIIKFINNEIPTNLALKDDKIGFSSKYDLNQNIENIKIMMDLLPEDDNNFNEKTLVITHHPPIFKPKTINYVIHSNWDIIKGGANEALAEKLNLDVIESFDKENNIGRICKTGLTFSEIKNKILKEFPEEVIRVVNKTNEDETFKKIAIISGFGLKNKKYINLAKKEEVELIISGDLTHEVAILAKKLNITLIDLNHHTSEVPGLYKLKKIVEKIDIPVEIINNGSPWNTL